MNLHIFVLIVVFVVNLFLGSYVAKAFFVEKKINRILVMTLFSFLMWAGIDFFLIVTSGNRFFLNDISFVLAFLSYTALMNFSLLLVSDYKDLKKKTVFLLYTPILLVFVIIFLKYFVANLFEQSEAFQKIDFYWIALVYIIGLLFSVMFVCIRNYSLIAKDKVKKQIEFLILAIGISLLGFMIMAGVSIVLDVKINQTMSVLGNLILTVILYSVIRYQLEVPLAIFISPKTIKTKITFPVLVLTSVILFFLGIVTYVFFENVVEKDLIDRFDIATQLKVNQIETFFSGERGSVLIIAKDHHFSDLLLESYGEEVQIIETHENTRLHQQDVLNEMRQGNVFEIFILNRDGEVVLSTSRENVGESKKNNDYFLNGMRGFGIGEIYYVSEREEGLIPVYAPIKNPKTNQIIGVAVSIVEKVGLNEIVTSTIGLGETGETFLIDSNYNRITPTRFPLGEFEGGFVENQNTRECFLHRYDVDGGKYEHVELKESVNYQRSHVFSAHKYIPALDWCMITEISKDEALTPLNNLLRFLYVTGFLAIVIFYLIVSWISKRITKPIVNLRRGVELIESGRRDYRVGTDANDEVGQLSRAFDKMTVAITKSESDIDIKVKKQTENISAQSRRIEDQQRATLNILEDVEEEKDKVETLAHDLEKFKLAVDNTSDHIAITDPSGVVVYINDSMKEDIGFSDAELASGKIKADDLWMGLMGAEFYENVWKTIKDQKSVFVGELTNQKKNGVKYDSMISISPVLDRDGKIMFFVSVERDITKEKEIDRAKTEFVSLASHQLRTPLSAVNWYAEMLLSGDAGKITKKQRKYIDEIYNGNQRMVELVNALLNVSRIELGTFSIDPKPTNIIAVFDDSIKELKQQIKLKELDVDVEYDEKLPIINLDQNLMGIIFQNILSNAVKYTPEKGKIGVKIHKKISDILISISDTGYGIPKNQYGRIFEKLFRADNVREKDTDGTGLGLYLVKSIVDEAGGKVWFESEENKGTTFYVSIPVSGMKKKVGQKGLSPA